MPFAKGNKLGLKHGQYGTTTYQSWFNMKQRCTNPDRHNYYLYGGSGIYVDIRWLHFQNFLDDMGNRPKGMTLDRIDPTKPYTKSNYRWATTKQQIANRRHKGTVKQGMWESK